MISVTVTVGTTSQSLEQLIQAVTLQGGPLPSNGRVAEIHIQFRVTGGSDFHLVYKIGTVGSTLDLATDSGRFFTSAAPDNYLEMRSPSGNQLSLKEFFLVAASGTAQARILAWYV